MLATSVFGEPAARDSDSVAYDKPSAHRSEFAINFTGARISPCRTLMEGVSTPVAVTCPIELFPATSQSEKTHFHQINTQTGHRLRQQMIDEETGRAGDARIKGAAMAQQGEFVEIDEDELKAIQMRAPYGRY